MSLVIPKGRVYIDEFDANGNTTGERYFGRTPGLTINITSESLEHYNSESGLNEKDDEVVTQIDRTGNLQVDEVTDDNLAAWIVGTVASIAQVATPVLDEAITAKQDRYFQLGVSTSNPTGVREAALDDVGGPGAPYTVDVDYSYDPVLARLYIIPGGGISDDDALTIDYTPAVKTRSQIASSSLASKEGAVRFIADNPKGENRDWFFPKAALKPNGDATLKQTDPVWFQMAFEIEVLKKDANTEAVYIDGRAA